MANDILALGEDDGRAEGNREGSAVSEKASKPRPVPELDVALAMALSFNGSPMAPDFFNTSARAKGNRSKKHLWKLSR